MPRWCGAMLEHVLDCLRACAQIDEVAVMSPDPDRLPPDVALLADAGADMNASLSAALAVLEGRGATRIAIVSADLPQLTPDDVTALVRPESGTGWRSRRITPGRAPTRRALRCRRASRFTSGRAASRSTGGGRALGMEPARVQRPGLAFDVDEPADVGVLRARAEARYAFLG